jgi:protein-S-isoprenylcysteine O-methyltransferase Ste14
MDSPKLWNDVTILWTVFTIYFALSARRIRIKKTTATRIYVLESFGALLAGLLVLWPKSHFFFLAMRFHNDFRIEVLGFSLVIAGLAISAWSRDVLGKNWTAVPMILTNHQLVTAGPYAYVRHPLYTGIIIALAGSVLASGECGALIGWILITSIFRIRSRREERILEAEFGSSYSEYRARTGFLLPRIAHV